MCKMKRSRHGDLLLHYEDTIDELIINQKLGSEYLHDFNFVHLDLLTQLRRVLPEEFALDVEFFSKLRSFITNWPTIQHKLIRLDNDQLIIQALRRMPQRQNQSASSDVRSSSNFSLFVGCSSTLIESLPSPSLIVANLKQKETDTVRKNLLLELKVYVDLVPQLSSRLAFVRSLLRVAVTPPPPVPLYQSHQQPCHANSSPSSPRMEVNDITSLTFEESLLSRALTQLEKINEI